MSSKTNSMNKPYFAKYLPVEGEIKERDWYKSPSGGILSQHNGSELLPDGWYKVKLFLCSRHKTDLLVEKYKGLVTDGKVLGNYYGDIDGDPCIEYPIGSKEFWRDPSGLHKVIGEISSEATWVTENMEFNNEDIQLRGCLQDLALIKCPTCKTFH